MLDVYKGLSLSDTHAVNWLCMQSHDDDSDVDYVNRCTL